MEVAAEFALRIGLDDGLKLERSAAIPEDPGFVLRLAVAENAGGAVTAMNDVLPGVIEFADEAGEIQGHVVEVDVMDAAEGMELLGTKRETLSGSFGDLRFGELTLEFGAIGGRVEIFRLQGVALFGGER